MVNVSKQPLGRSFSDELFRQLATRLAQSSVTKEKMILAALLTDKEQIMLAKRLAAVYMIRQNFPEALIVRTLNLSRSTVYQFKKDYERGRFEEIGGTGRAMSKKERDELWRRVGHILRLGMPPVAGDKRKYWMQEHFGKPIPKRRRR